MVSATHWQRGCAQPNISPEVLVGAGAIAFVAMAVVATAVPINNKLADNIRNQNWLNSGLGSFVNCAGLATEVQKLPKAAYVKVWKGQSGLKSTLTLGITAGRVHGYWIYDEEGRVLKQDHQEDMRDYRQESENRYVWIGYNKSQGVNNEPDGVSLQAV